MNSFINRAARYLVRKTDQKDVRGTSNCPEYVTGACHIFEIQYGHFESVRKQRAIDGQGQAIPWFTYPAIDYFDQLDFRQKHMLEWGSGHSSLFFSARVEKLYSIEHDGEWFDQVKRFTIRNQELVLADKSVYASFPRTFDRTFDIILIDGVERHACGNVALELLAPGGLIILDNSDRYPDISETFRRNDLIEVDFHGFGPINNYTWTTSIFLTRDFALAPVTRQPKIPIGGGY